MLVHNPYLLLNLSRVMQLRLQAAQLVVGCNQSFLQASSVCCLCAGSLLDLVDQAIQLAAFVLHIIRCTPTAAQSTILA